MRIVVGISGGVDSAIVAALLQERGWDVVGCFLKVAITGAPCPWETDLPMAHRVAAHLNIPLIVKDVSVEYEREVLKPMIAAYQRGETPNPDATCNRWVKFDALAAVACEVGAERIATGHYARVKNNFSLSSRGGAPARRSLGEGGRGGGAQCSTPGAEQTQGYRHGLWRGVDHTKDQSYFLWQLTQEQLSMCEFPIGEWRKDDVRAEARRRGLPNWDRESTSGVCFLGNVNLVELFNSKIFPERSEAKSKGNDRQVTVVTTAGDILGTVPNAEALTIGQRIPLAGQPTPRYVVAHDRSSCPKSDFGQGHRVIVSATPGDPARLTRTITTSSPHWIGEPPKFSPLLPEGELEGVRMLRCTARIRHRQEPIPCTVSRFSPSSRGGAQGGACVGAQGELEGVRLRVELDTPLTGVAPGQAVVLTDGDRVLGGAVIDRRLQ